MIHSYEMITQRKAGRKKNRRRREERKKYDLRSNMREYEMGRKGRFMRRGEEGMRSRN